MTGNEGSPLNPAPGGDVLVATFMDNGVIGSITDYSASIAWGDGTTSAPTRITSQGTPNGVVFSVFGNNTYKEEGVYPVTVTITKTAAVPPRSLRVRPWSPMPPHRQLIHGFDAQQGSFLPIPCGRASTDANTTAPVTDFTAVHRLGRRLAESAWEPSSRPAGGAFNVEGTHAYARPCPRAVTTRSRSTSPIRAAPR